MNEFIHTKPLISNTALRFVAMFCEKSKITVVSNLIDFYRNLDLWHELCTGPYLHLKSNLLRKPPNSPLSIFYQTLAP